MLKIIMANETEVKWTDCEYDNYSFANGFLLIYLKGKTVGAYNMDYIISFIVR